MRQVAQVFSLTFQRFMRQLYLEPYIFVYMYMLHSILYLMLQPIIYLLI